MNNQHKFFTKTFVQVLKVDTNGNSAWANVEGKWKYALHLMDTDNSIIGARLNVKTFDTYDFTTTENIIKLINK